jgi:hypothetical protein
MRLWFFTKFAEEKTKQKTLNKDDYIKFNLNDSLLLIKNSH